MIIAIWFIVACVLVAGAVFIKDAISARARIKAEEIAKQILASAERQHVEIDLNKTPKPRTEKEIRDALKSAHPPTRR